MAVELTKPHIPSEFTPYATKEQIELELLDGSTYTLNKNKFFAAFIFVFGSDFKYFIETVNKRNKLQERVAELEKTLRNAIDTRKCDEYTAISINDVISLANSAGYYSGIVHELREEFVDTLSWDGWIDACRMYETFAGVHRDELV